MPESTPFDQPVLEVVRAGDAMGILGAAVVFDLARRRAVPTIRDGNAAPRTRSKASR